MLVPSWTTDSPHIAFTAMAAGWSSLLRRDVRAPRMAQLVDAALDAIASSFEAKRTVVIDKAVVDGGSDHYARLTGAKRLLEFTLAGRPKPEKEMPPHGPVTMEAIEAALAAAASEEEKDRLANESVRR